MWKKWFPWRLIVRLGARTQGFLDPIAVLTQLQRFSQPSEVMAPTELLRAGAVLQARGLMNSQAIQHNLDWVWPYWVERQFDPKDAAFLPRAFNLTLINLTHRNWTAVGVPDVPKYPLVDPRGLLTPHFDGWSLDAWLVTEKGMELIPSRQSSAEQKVDMKEGWAIETRVQSGGLNLMTRAEVVTESGSPVCHWEVEGLAESKANIVISLRPYNPEGVSFVHSIEKLSPEAGWKVNGKQPVFFDAVPEKHGFSYYRRGDVHRFIPKLEDGERMDCRVGLATAAALFELKPGVSRRVSLRIPFAGKKFAPVDWPSALKDCCRLKTDIENFQFLFDTAVRTLILHSPDDVYPGPYTYKRFWFRDAAFILQAMLSAGMAERVERALDRFHTRQMPSGYFLSQEGEWDSNGEALWIWRRYCEVTGKRAKKEWRSSILRAAQWILHKRLSVRLDRRHAGLLPAGFSAEHLGPNDFYYWDNFWAIAGLRAASYLSESFGDTDKARELKTKADDFSETVRRNIDSTMERIGSSMIPASPYRRMDAGAIGSMVMGYPLRLCPAEHKPLLQTAEFLMETSFVDGGFFQEINHSGINPYLTLHVAQVLLRAGDERFFSIMRSIARMASPTGQWPEAIHPRTSGGCMGDGQHVWAAAEWVMMVQNCFVREEDGPSRLVLCQGITPDWLASGKESSLGPVHTSFGEISVRVRPVGAGALVSWEAKWHDKEPCIEIKMPGFKPITVEPGSSSVELAR